MIFVIDKVALNIVEIKTFKNKLNEIKTGLPREIFTLFSKCARVNDIYSVPVRTSKYQMEHNMNQIMALNLEISDSSIVHAPLSNMQNAKSQENLPQGGNNWNIALYL